MTPVTPRSMASPATPAARLLLAAVAAATAACASAPPEASSDSLAGCYFFQPDDAARSFRLPDGIRLTTSALEGWPAIMQRGGVMVAVTLTDQGSADYPFGYWLLEDDGTVEAGYPAGGGIVLDLAVGRDRLEGTARAVGDVDVYGDEAETASREVPVRLDRGDCP
jgi:hypothetical protein